MGSDRLQFTKMHGIGNDYVYVDGRDLGGCDPGMLSRTISDRHRGIGADGLIIVDPAGEGDDWDVRMRMFNADGSEAQMCGNGIRCVAKYAVDRGIVSEEGIRIATGAGILDVEVISEGGSVLGATVDMGEAMTRLRDLPMVIPGMDSSEHAIGLGIELDAFLPLHAHALKAAGTASIVSCVSMGNPHIVFWCERIDQIDLQLIGPDVETHDWFPERVNAHFVSVDSPDQVTVRTWERGSGETLACGTGASAVCAAGALEGRCNDTLHAVLPGGGLDLKFDRSSNHVLMSGPAREVFTGSIDPSILEVA